MTGPTRARAGRRRWDLVLTIVLLVLLIVFAAGAGYAGLLVGFVSDPCGSTVRCDFARLSAGVDVALYGPAVASAIATVSVVARLVRARIAFWVPLVGFAAATVVWIGGALLASSAVPD